MILKVCHNFEGMSYLERYVKLKKVSHEFDGMSHLDRYVKRYVMFRKVYQFKKGMSK